MFEDWHSQYLRELIRIPVDIDLELENGEIVDIHGCALVRSDFPHMEVLQSELIDEAYGIIARKYGL